MKRNARSQAGQVGLIILLVVVVMLTVGVSVASRSVSELKLSRQEQESTRALNLAESGIEDALSKDLSTIVAAGTCVPGFACHPPTMTNVDYTVGGLDSLTNIHLDEGHTIELKLANPGSTGDYLVSWTQDGVNACDSAAIEIAQFNNSNEVDRVAYRPQGCGDYANLTDVSASGGVFTTPSINFDGDTDEFARIKVLGTDTTLNVTGTSLPPQAYEILSTATLDDGTTRTVKVVKLADSLPSIFDYVLFSGETLVK